ncbi:tetratricopeptide repeat protein, partial [Flavobacterium sp.]
MRKLWFFIVFTCVVSAQKKVSKPFDSVGYYFEQIQYHKKANNYRNCLNYAQKAINYAQKKSDEKALGDSYFNLGLIYFDLKKNEDALDAFVRSIAFYSNLAPSREQALCYYYLGLTYIEQNNTALAENNLNKAQAIYQKLKIHSAIEMINLQRAIVYKRMGRNNQAQGILEKIVSLTDTVHNRKIVPEALYHLGMLE